MAVVSAAISYLYKNQKVLQTKKTFYSISVLSNISRKELRGLNPYIFIKFG